MEFFDFLLGWFVAIISVIVSQVLGYLFNKRTMKSEHEHRERMMKSEHENSEKMLRMQFYKEDKKKAIIDLHELLKKRYPRYDDLKRDINAFLDGDLGLFLPEKLKAELRQELSTIDSLIAEHVAVMYGPEPEYPDDYEDWYESLSPEEQLDNEITNRLSDLKDKMGKKIRRYFAEE